MMSKIVDGLSEVTAVEDGVACKQLVSIKFRCNCKVYSIQLALRYDAC